MGMPIEQDIILTDSLSKFSSPSEADFSEQPNIKNKAEYQLLKLRVKGEKLNLKNNYAEALPTLVLSGSIGTFSSSNNFNIFQDRNIVVLKNLDGTSAPEIKNQNLYWSTYSLVQLGLNVPIFSGLSRSSKVQQSKLNLQKAENTLKNYEEAMNLQLQTAKVNLQNSQKSLVIQKRNVDLAQNVSNVTYKKYLAGVGSSLEVTNAESSLKEAQVNYFNALFDYLVNKIDYEQAAGLTKF
jgi:outer membrane protein TolC